MDYHMTDKMLVNCKDCGRETLSVDHEHCSRCLEIFYNENDVDPDLVCDWDEPIGHQE